LSAAVAASLCTLLGGAAEAEALARQKALLAELDGEAAAREGGVAARAARSGRKKKAKKKKGRPEVGSQPRDGEEQEEGEEGEEQEEEEEGEEAAERLDELVAQRKARQQPANPNPNPNPNPDPNPDPNPNPNPNQAREQPALYPPSRPALYGVPSDSAPVTPRDGLAREGLARGRPRHAGTRTPH
jgi:hypothetical protein